MTKKPDKKNVMRRVGLTSAEDVRKLMTSLINKLSHGQIERERARAIGYLAGLVLDCLKFERESELEKRLQKLESLLDTEQEEGKNT